MLKCTRLVIAHPVERSVALDTYLFNYAKEHDELGVRMWERPPPADSSEMEAIV